MRDPREEVKQWTTRALAVDKHDVVEDGIIVVTIITETGLSTVLWPHFAQDDNSCTHLTILLRLHGLIPLSAGVQQVFLRQDFLMAAVDPNKTFVNAGDHIVLTLTRRLPPLRPRRKRAGKKTRAVQVPARSLPLRKRLDKAK